MAALNNRDSEVGHAVQAVLDKFNAPTVIKPETNVTLDIRR